MKAKRVIIEKKKKFLIKARKLYLTYETLQYLYLAKTKFNSLQLVY